MTVRRKPDPVRGAIAKKVHADRAARHAEADAIVRALAALYRDYDEERVTDLIVRAVKYVGDNK